MKKERNGRMTHLGRKVGSVVAGMLVVSIAVIVILCVSMFYSLTMDMLRDQCVDGTNVLAYRLEHYSGTEDLTQMLDDLKEQMGCEFTIFYGDERAYTTIVQEDGKRAVGTKLSADLADTVLVKGQAYVGNAYITGVEHICSYVPTRDENGKITGLIFSGISMAQAVEQLNHTVKTACNVGVVLVVVCILLLTVYIKMGVSGPLKKLTALAQTMEQGELGLGSSRDMTVDIRSNDEIGFLAHTFENTIFRLRGYIEEISSILAAISQGNLAVKTKQDYVGDFTSIKASLDGILDKLNSTMSQIMESTDCVSNGSEQMAIGAQALSQGAVEQASAVEELDGNMHAISRQVEQTAANAAQASSRVEGVSVQLSESNQKMQEMIQAMQEINDRSNEIVKIINTIEDISAQTNILALNAAVEAARAGETGKGFAVVAQEVRELAGKSSEASKSTTALIERSIEAVKRGTQIASETAQQLMAAVEGSGEIVDTTNWIADAARNQAASVGEIREQISQISTVVQTNSATAEESAATSEQLSQQARLLKGLVGMFRLNTTNRSRR